MNEGLLARAFIRAKICQLAIRLLVVSLVYVVSYHSHTVRNCSERTGYDLGQLPSSTFK